jgi:transposase
MPRKYSPEVRRQVIELARSGTRVKQLAATFGVAEVTIYNWLKQDRVDRGEELGKTTEQQLELTAAWKRINQLETELAVSRKINEVFLKEGAAQKTLPGDRVSGRAGDQHRAPSTGHPFQGTEPNRFGTRSPRRSQRYPSRCAAP